MSKEKEQTSAEEILVLHEKWVSWAQRHLREIVAGVLLALFLIAGWTMFQYQAERKETKAALSLFQAVLTKDPSQRLNLLSQIVEKYGDTIAGLQARMVLFDDAYSQGELKKAYDYLKKVEQKGKESLKQWISLGEGYILEEQGQYVQAKDKYLQVLNSAIGLDRVVLLDLARIYELLKKPSQAKIYYEKFLALEPQGERLDFVEVKLAQLENK